MNNILRLLAWALLLGLVVTGCRDRPPATAADDSFALRVHLPKEPRRLFPVSAANAYEVQVNDLIYQYLLDFDPESGAVVPELAAELPEVMRLPDGKIQYRFRVRDDARWSDGEPVSVADVIFTYKTIFLPGLGNSTYQSGLRELLDVRPVIGQANTVDVVATRATFNGAAYYGNVPILPEHIYDPEHTLRSVSIREIMQAETADSLSAELRAYASPEATQVYGRSVVVGSGPYRFDQWVSGQFIRLVRDTTYWAANRAELLFTAHPDTITFIPVPDAGTALTMLENGQLDVVTNLVPREANRLRALPDSSFRVYTPRQLTRTFIYLNTDDPVLSDRQTRRGLAHLLDQEGFLEDVMLGYGEPLDGPYHPAQPYAKAAEADVPFSVDAARRNFEAAGWKDSDADGIYDKVINGRRRDLEIEFLYPSVSKNAEALGLLYAEDARRAGVRVVPVGKEYGALLGDLSQRRYQMVQGALGGDPLPDDPYPLWHTASNHARGKNRSGFGNAVTDALIDSIRSETELSRNHARYKVLADSIARAQPIINLIVPQERIAVRSRFIPVITERRPGYYLPGFQLRQN